MLIIYQATHFCDLFKKNTIHEISGIFWKLLQISGEYSWEEDNVTWQAPLTNNFPRILSYDVSAKNKSNSIKNFNQLLDVLKCGKFRRSPFG